MLFGKREEKKSEPVVAIDDKSLQAEKRPKKRRKPQDRSKLTRNSQVQIRLTNEEVAKLKGAAKANDMSLADFVMSGVSRTRRIVVPDAGILRSELLHVGRNLNQALRLAHTLRKEGQLIDTVSIEIAVERVEVVLERLNSWLVKWDVDLTYQTSKKEE